VARRASEADLVEEQLALDGLELTVVRPRDSEELLDDAAFEREEFLPYWAELWPSGVALARTVATRSLRGARALELGCGLGLPSIAAASAGARVLATDWSEDALRFAALNAERNDVEIEVARCDWAHPEPVVNRGPWDLVLAADVLYERRNLPLLLDLLPRLVGDRGEVLLADPGRPPTEDFLAAVDRDWTRHSTTDRTFTRVTVHRLRRRPR
jgi:predicted nicotinamide N-methyase